MRIFILTLTVCLSTLFSSAQNYNRWSVEVGFGNHFGLKPAINKTNFSQIQAVQLGGRFMANEYIGVMVNVGYDLLDFNGMGKNNQNLIRTSVQGVINIGSICNFQAKTAHFGMLFHTGIGATHLKSKAHYKTNPRDPLFKNSDDMFSVYVGLTPQFKLHSRVTLYVDYTLSANFKQDNSYDFSSKLSGDGIGGAVHNLMLGLRFNLGKHKEHADWM